MRLNKTYLSDTELKLVITADETFMSRVKEHALKHLVQGVKVPGFRQGKVPLALAEKQVDQQLLQSEFLEEAVNRLYTEAIKAESVRPVANPQISLKKFVPFTELEFEATVEVVGEVKLANYKSIKKSLKDVVITAEDVNAIMSNLQQRAADKKAVDRDLREGDEAVMDFSGKDQTGNKVNGTDAKDYAVIIGSNALIPGFETALIGMRAGSTKAFDLILPNDYQVKALAGKKVNFEATVHKVNELLKPKLDDDFAAKIGPFTSLKELKADIKKQLTLEREAEARRSLENELIGEISSRSKLAVPRSLVDQQIKQNEDEERKNLAYRGQTWQEHLSEEGVSEEEHRERNRPAAEESVKTGLLLAEIAEREKIGFTPEEVDARIELLKGQYTDPAMRLELDKPDNRRDIEGRIVTEKTLNALVGYASAN